MSLVIYDLCRCETMDQKQVLERWLRQLKKNEISPDAVGLGPDKEQAMRYIRDELGKIEAIEKKQVSAKQ
jgi:hypothetical protein